MMSRRPQRGAVDPYCNAVMFKSVQEGIYQGFASEEVIPFWIVQVGSNNGGFSGIAFTHEFEKGINLLWLEGQIPQFVDHQEVVTTKSFDQFWGNSISK